MPRSVFFFSYVHASNVLLQVQSFRQTSTTSHQQSRERHPGLFPAVGSDPQMSARKFGPPRDLRILELEILVLAGE